MSSESFKKLNGGNLDDIKAGKVFPTVPKTVESFVARDVATLITRPSTDEAKLNKTERERLNHLRALKLMAIGVQSITLKLGDDCRFTPDFNYIGPKGEMVFEDVKGFQRDDALVKIKVAARMFTWARFLIVKKEKNHGWNIIEIKP